MAFIATTECEVTIDANASVSSSSGNLGGLTLVGLWVPSVWTAAAITFLMSRDDGANFASVYDALLGEVTIPSSMIATGEARRFALDPRQFIGAKQIKVRSGVNGTAVTQAAARTLYLITRPLA
mgnify:FL=1